MKEESIHEYIERRYRAKEISKKDYQLAKVIVCMTDGFKKTLEPLKKAIEISKEGK